jgi:hypothetical protein
MRLCGVRGKMRWGCAPGSGMWRSTCRSLPHTSSHRSSELWIESTHPSSDEHPVFVRNGPHERKLVAGRGHDADPSAREALAMRLGAPLIEVVGHELCEIWVSASLSST